MARLLKVLLFTACGYGAGVALAVVGVTMLSANSHDRNVEAVMTAIFVAGPIAAIIGGIIGLIATRARTPSPTATTPPGSKQSSG